MKVAALKILAIFVLICSAMVAHAQRSVAGPLVGDSLMRFLNILAHDSMTGRETATEGERKAARFIASKFEEFGLHKPFFKNDSNPGYFQYFPFKPGRRDTLDIYRKHGINVAGILWGTEKPYEFLVISGHYDHLGQRGNDIYSGADDNASGTAGIIELARQFTDLAQSDQRPLRSIMFVLFSGEEKGLLGSKHFTEGMPLLHEMVVANLNVDMVGRTDTAHKKSEPYLYIIGSRMLSEDLHQISEATNRTCCKLNLDYSYADPDHPLKLYNRSDHYNFAKLNIPVIFYFSGLHKDYHKPTDKAHLIEPQVYLARMQLIFHTALELASRPQKPRLNQPIEK